MQAINDFILAAAGQPWVLLLVLACCVIDGFFPPIPSESVVVGLAAVAATADVPNPYVLMAVAALGAFTGDNIAYLIGRKVGTTRWAWMRGQRMQGAFRWAGAELRKRPASLILVARFVPIGRVAVNLTAGATHYQHLRFVGLTSLSAVLWAAYSVGIGLFFGQWFEENHLLGAAIAIVCAVALGIVVDLAINKLRGKPNVVDRIREPEA
ncbi:SNARE associated Golgi protein [Pseudarthrobacter chlorophenolicus A6]|uniref:SNARE associated Golgi protein n=1 Tax=Pseudarthrobacter chlorophenolicus (strain ATCC 700700 / DSM 12829 / CIP 107037 / JCM 12360 / KCTC 9906 / NCIMB 13794 / A6) TaxID=452863 RepID=B8HEU1_PSECP|nr:DedA family protein [Pseudarthrobacter chlorophenolicus]ACL39207.1 SNARE associated Golgi protein [Pseudarthrobacter chlorophenolicus A6]SDR02801.1 membrane protein DedA, SNARE-associated domain [Pseudarthrobacter chlorophenolicus]